MNTTTDTSGTTAAQRDAILRLIDQLGAIPPTGTMSALLCTYTPYHASISLVHTDYVAMGLNKRRRLQKWVTRYGVTTETPESVPDTAVGCAVYA